MKGKSETFKKFEPKASRKLNFNHNSAFRQKFGNFVLLLDSTYSDAHGQNRINNCVSLVLVLKRSNFAANLEETTFCGFPKLIIIFQSKDDCFQHYKGSGICCK